MPTPANPSPTHAETRPTCTQTRPSRTTNGAALPRNSAQIIPSLPPKPNAWKLFAVTRLNGCRSSNIHPVTL